MDDDMFHREWRLLLPHESGEEGADEEDGIAQVDINTSSTSLEWRIIMSPLRIALYSFLILSVLSVFISTTSARTWYINPSGTGDAPTIQAGIDSCVVGDTVLVAAGTFTGVDNRRLDFGGKDIVAKSVYGADSTIIDCEDADCGFYLHLGESNAAVIEGFTIENGRYLGGIHCSSASPVIRHNKISNNMSEYGAGINCTASSSAIHGNTISYNGYVGFTNKGGGIYVNNGTHEIYDNIIQGNEYDRYGGGIYCENSDVYIHDNIISGNDCLADHLGEGGGIYCSGGTSTITNNTISNNDAAYGGGVYISTSNASIVRENDILANYASFACAGKFTSDVSIDKSASFAALYGQGGGVYCSGTSLLVIEKNTINNNESDNGGGIFCTDTPSIRENIIAHNQASFDGLCDEGGSGGGVYLESASPSITNNTIYANRTVGMEAAHAGGGIFIDSTSDPVISRCIIMDNIIGASGAGGGIYNANTTVPVISCCDVFNNDVENYGGNLPDMTGSNGNISADPKFCDSDSDDFTLRTDSPCLPGNHPDEDVCGLIGALGLGCAIEEPFISSIVDVGNDQGGQVSIGWYKSVWDSVSSPQPILTYEVYRRIDGLPSPAAEVLDNDEINSGFSEKNGKLLYPPGDWHYLSNIPAHCEDVYYIVAPTLEDSCAYNDSLYYSTFFIRATTSVPSLYFDSPVDSGYSVDNLAPGVPESFVVAYNTGSGNYLSWLPCEDEDFQYFKIYRSVGPDSTSWELAQMTIDTEWSDDPKYDGWIVYYKLTALDFAGNESDPAYPSGQPITVPEHIIPKELVLNQNHPNPFNPTTTISFSLPERVRASLSIYDVEGKLVKTLVNDVMDEGFKDIAWDGKNTCGNSVSSGVYFYRLKAGKKVLTRKVVLLK